MWYVDRDDDVWVQAPNGKYVIIGNLADGRVRLGTRSVIDSDDGDDWEAIVPHGPRPLWSEGRYTADKVSVASHRPAVLVDGEGDRWELQADGKYDCRGRVSRQMLGMHRTESEIAEEYKGIRLRLSGADAEGPPRVVDGEGDTWVWQSEGGYKLWGNSATPRTLGYIRENYGIRGETGETGDSWEERVSGLASRFVDAVEDGRTATAADYLEQLIRFAAGKEE